MPENSQHPLYSDHLEDWQDCRNFYLGEKEVKYLGDRYLPKPEAMTTNEYNSYKKRADFFAVLDRTIAGMSGAIDRKEPSITLPASGHLDFIKENADASNSTLRQFANNVVIETMLTGRGGILVERDEDPEIEPYLVYYQAESIINWSEDSQQNLIAVVLLEYYYETSAKDIFQKTKVKRYRVLTLEDGHYTQRLFKEVSLSDKAVSLQQDGDDIMPTKNGNRLTYIPFVFCNSRSISSKINKPPFYDLMLKCQQYYRVAADYANSCYFVGNPILAVSGAKPENAIPLPPPQNIVGQVVDPSMQYERARTPHFDLVLGSSRATFLPEGAKIELVESKGAGVEPNRQRLLDIKSDMAVLGARILENQRSGVEAAETATIRQSGEMSTLASIVINVSAAIQKALLYLAEWSLGTVEKDEIKFHLNDDFIETTINPQLLAQLSALVSQGLMSWETFYYNLVIGELTIPGLSADDERDKIQTDPLPHLQNIDANDFSGLVTAGETNNQQVPPDNNVDANNINDLQNQKKVQG